MVDIVIVLCAFLHQDIKDVLNMKFFPPSVERQINAKMASKGITLRHAEFNLPLIASRGMFLIYLLANVNMCESMLVRPI